ncbi:hypothetical protein ACCD06_33845 [Azospirillum sp. CT11-132]|uniref:hypothetical protein n=1 Tax=Azospirillum sp. CT11-132 TaxID=3396317 RepID=UPI0039A5925C
MPLVKDRVKQTTTSTGTGSVALSGTVSGFQTFAQAFSSGNQVYYCIADGTNWETGIGTYTAGSPGSLSRDSILASSNSGAAVSWGVGTKDVFVTLPASAIGAVSMPAATTKTAAYSVTVADVGKVIPCSGTWTLSLLSSVAAGNGFIIGVCNVSTGWIAVAPNGTDTINGRASLALGPFASVWLVANGSGGWLVIGATFTSSAALDPANKDANIALSNNNATAVNSAGVWASVRLNSSIPQGKFYLEARQDVTDPSPARSFLGLVSSTVLMASVGNIGGAGGWSLTDQGTLSQNGSITSNWSPQWGAAGKVVGLHVDATTLSSVKGWFSIDGTMLNGGDPATGANPAFTITGSPTLYPAISLLNGQQMTVRCAQSSWSYTPATGYNQIP